MPDRDSDYWPTQRPGAFGPRRTITLTDLIRIPVHRWRMVAAVAGAGLLAAVGYLGLVPPTVSASAVVAVRPVVTDAFTYPGAGADRSVNMNVESGIATGTEVIGKLAGADGEDPVRVRDALTVEVPTGGQILRFVYRAPSADEAVRTVNLAAQTYLEVRRARYEQQRTSMLQSYDESIAKVVAQQTAVQRRVDKARNGAADAALAELSAINNQLVELNSSRTEIAAIDVTPGWITQTAEPSLADDDANPLLYVLAGVLGGALLGVVLTYLRESVDRRVRSAGDAHEATLLPLLGTVRRRGVRVSAHAVDADVRYVAMAIAERFGSQVPTPVVVISARAQEDTTLMTASLAVALAADGRSVYVGDDSGRLDALRDMLMADRRRVPSRPFVPEQADITAAIPAGIGGSPAGMATGAAMGLATGSPAQITAGLPTGPAGLQPGSTDRSPTPIAARKPSPRPIPPPRPVPATEEDVNATMVLPRFPPESPASAESGGTQRGTVHRTSAFNTLPEPTIAKVAVPTLPADAVTVGTGMVRTGSYHRAPVSDILLFNAPPAESDERGVREARSGTAIVVVERDRTRVEDLRRLVDRLRAAGAEPLGFVLTRNGRG